MPIREGGSVIRPSTGKPVLWTPTEPIADEYEAALLYDVEVLGVIGNGAHLRRSGGHTPWCTEGWNGRACKFGKVYAIDLEIDDAHRFWPWLQVRLKGGAYPWVFYANCLGEQISRVDGFTTKRRSSDVHLHLSGLAGHESTNSSILRDWHTERSRPTVITTPGDDMGPETVFNVPKLDGSGQLEARTFKEVLGQLVGKLLEQQWALEALQDAVIGGKGPAYETSRLRRDHGFQLEETQRQINTALAPVLAELRALRAALEPPAPGTATR